ncbi:reverse transcriptase, partial [Phytophthora megakarya]
EQVKAIDDFFESRRKAGQVRESKSPHSAPTYCVKKPQGGWRIVHAYNKLNDATIPAQTPIPRKDFIIDTMSKSTIYSALDLRDEFYHILMRESDIPLTANGVRPDPEKVRVINELPTPSNVKELRQFLGLATYLCKYVDNYAGKIRPLSQRLKKEAAWNWTGECQQAFNAGKLGLTEAPILAVADQDRPFHVVCDESDFAIGCASTTSRVS